MIVLQLSKHQSMTNIIPLLSADIYYREELGLVEVVSRWTCFKKLFKKLTGLDSSSWCFPLYCSYTHRHTQYTRPRSIFITALFKLRVVVSLCWTETYPERVTKQMCHSRVCLLVCAKRIMRKGIPKHKLNVEVRPFCWFISVGFRELAKNPVNSWSTVIAFTLI